jgi:hypothetical protein
MYFCLQWVYGNVCVLGVANLQNGTLQTHSRTPKWLLLRADPNISSKGESSSKVAVNPGTRVPSPHSAQPMLLHRR